MNILLINEHDHSVEATAFEEAAVAEMALPVASAYAEYADKLNVWGIGRLPCVARIHGERAVHQVSDASGLATFDVDADAAVAALETP